VFSRELEVAQNNPKKTNKTREKSGKKIKNNPRNEKCLENRDNFEGKIPGRKIRKNRKNSYRSKHERIPEKRNRAEK